MTNNDEDRTFDALKRLPWEAVEELLSKDWRDEMGMVPISDNATDYAVDLGYAIAKCGWTPKEWDEELLRRRPVIREHREKQWKLHKEWCEKQEAWWTAQRTKKWWQIWI